jgi:Coenzyme PQQ synthesis protein D (PqqD)
MLYRRAGGVIERRIAGETVIVPIVRGLAAGSAGDGEVTQFFVLNESGQALWELLATPATADSMAQHLTHTFEVSPEQARADVARFIEQLKEHGMLLGSEST